jgi:hypothetical protein
MRKTVPLLVLALFLTVSVAAVGPAAADDHSQDYDPCGVDNRDRDPVAATSSNASAQPTDRVTVDAGRDDGGAFLFVQADATEDGSTGACSATSVRTEYGGVDVDTHNSAAVNDQFTGAGAGAFASPFFVGAGAGGGTELVGDEDGTGGGAGCGVPTLAPTDADCGYGIS